MAQQAGLAQQENLAIAEAAAANNQPAPPNLDKNVVLIENMSTVLGGMESKVAKLPLESVDDQSMVSAISNASMGTAATNASNISRKMTATERAIWSAGGVQKGLEDTKRSILKDAENCKFQDPSARLKTDETIEMIEDLEEGFDKILQQGEELGIRFPREEIDRWDENAYAGRDYAGNSKYQKKTCPVPTPMDVAAPSVTFGPTTTVQPIDAAYPPSVTIGPTTTVPTKPSAPN